MDDRELLILAIAVFIVGLATGLFLATNLEQSDMEHKAIKLGVAEYYINKDNNKTFHYFIEPKN